MAAPPDLHSLRLALLQQPGDSERWQELIDLIQALGGGVLLADLDGLFEEPLATPDLEAAARRNQVLEQGLEAHRAGHADQLQRAVGALEELDPDGAWTHALHGLLAEMGGTCGYAAFTRALDRDSANPWFRFWVSVAALRRRDWCDFACQALALADSDTLDHQVLVLAAVYHLIAAALVTLTPELCRVNDLRVFDLVHPDAIAHGRDQLVMQVLRYGEKERRKMMRIVLVYLQRHQSQSPERWMELHRLHELLRWRIIGLAEPGLSRDLYAALQRQLQQVPDLSRQPGDLHNLLPRRPDLVFGDHHATLWRDYRLTLPPSL